MFQSTRPRGARRKFRGILSIYRQVSIHAPARGATTVNMLTDVEYNVSIHAPARGATFTSMPPNGASMFQSTRPRGARRCNMDDSANYLFVSIHAPARGATKVVSIVVHLRHVSIHAPARGATIFIMIPLRSSVSFNPRARAGRDSFGGVFV